MAASLKRILPSLVVDVLVILALAFPALCTYLRWPVLGIYVLISWALFRMVIDNLWIVTIVRDRATRIAHGLEHATIAVLSEEGFPTLHGFTHGRDRFVVALGEGGEGKRDAVQQATAKAIRRILDGERSLAYHSGCGTSEVVFAVSLWLVYMSCVLLSFLVGGAVPIFFAFSVIVFRIWLACETALGLLAQRLFTVSTAFATGAVVDAREVRRVCGRVCPNDESWFEIVIDAPVAPSTGGLVAPGTLG
jgi:hypothetical protein